LDILISRVGRPRQSIAACSCDKHLRGESYPFEFRKGEGCFHQMRQGCEQAGLKTVKWLQSILVTIYVLEPVGAAAVTSLGWEACRILKIDGIRSEPLWFAGYLFVYNFDRLYPDPADPVNVPVRWRKTLKLRSARICLIMLSSLVLIIWPVLTGRWWLVLALGLAVVLLQFYSRPIPGTCHRIKDLPYIKSLSVPGLIAGALVLWPCLENGGPLRTKECFVFLWCLLVLTINGLVFDYRDIAGDAAFGTRTLPVELGRRNTIYLLLALMMATVGVSGWLAANALVSPATPVVMIGGCAGLFLLILGQFRPMTISVFADLFLMLPALAQFLP
jgi:4-hydroxybenzoate polyprenyltransferase